VARRSRPIDDISNKVDEINRLLIGFKEQLQAGDVRAKVLALVPVFHQLRDLGSSLIAPDDGNAARDRILEYFRNYPKTIIDGDEIMVVSGIGEWARRIRELRVEQGWWIYSGVTFREMADAGESIESSSDIDITGISRDQYILMREEPDPDAAERWRSLNEIRRSKLSVKDKILEYLRRNVGKPISGEDLRYLAADRSEWPRRTRELRTEEGWPVVTRMSGRPDLPVGVYLLEEDKQAEPHDRHIPDDVRVEVLTRDKFRCTECHWTRENLKPGDPRKLLELHHVKFHSEKGENTADNLITLCNVHHDKLHRERKSK
jgi:hypothetical protein